MSIQQKLSRQTAALKRRLFDNNIRLMGIEFDVIRLHVERDMYGDETNTVITRSDMTMIISYPGEIPLNRFRYNASNNQDAAVDKTSVFFYDILPIEAYAQWQDEVEENDLLFHTVLDEKGNSIKILLKVADDLGSFSTDLIWRKLLVAPYSGIIEPEVRTILDTF